MLRCGLLKLGASNPRGLVTLLALPVHDGKPSYLMHIKHIHCSGTAVRSASSRHSGTVLQAIERTFPRASHLSRVLKHSTSATLRPVLAAPALQGKARLRESSLEEVAVALPLMVEQAGPTLRPPFEVGSEELGMDSGQSEAHGTVHGRNFTGSEVEVHPPGVIWFHRVHREFCLTTGFLALLSPCANVAIMGASCSFSGCTVSCLTISL
jgi:hypothetical protein